MCREARAVLRVAMLPDVSANGDTVSFRLLLAAFHDRTPVYELASVLPRGARLFGDKASNSQAAAATMGQETGIRLIAIRRTHMAPHP